MAFNLFTVLQDGILLIINRLSLGLIKSCTVWNVLVWSFGINALIGILFGVILTNLFVQNPLIWRINDWNVKIPYDAYNGP